MTNSTSHNQGERKKTPGLWLHVTSLIKVSVNPPSWIPSVWLCDVVGACYCQASLLFPTLFLSLRQVAGVGQEPGESSGLWQCRIHTGGTFPILKSSPVCSWALTIERHLVCFRPVMLPWEHSQSSLLENRSAKYSIPSEPGVLRT